MKKILIINNSSHFCGVDVYCLLLYKLLKNKYSFKFLIKKNSDFHNRLKEQGLEENISFLSSNFFTIKKKFKKILTKYNIDIVHIHTAAQYFYSSITKNISKKINKKIRIIITRHNSFKLNFIPNFWFIKNCDYVIAISKYVQNMLKKQFGKYKNKIKLIYNSLDIKEKNFKTEKTKSKTFKLGFIGRVTKKKGLHKVLQALACIDQKHHGKIKLIVAGNISNKKYKIKLEKIISQSGLENIVEWVGFIKDKKKFYNSIDLLTVPSLISWEEAFGLIIIESLYYETPVISFESGAIPEILNYGEYGYIIKDENEKKMAEKISYLFENRNDINRIRIKSHKYVIKNFSGKRFIEQYIKIFEH